MLFSVWLVFQEVAYSDFEWFEISNGWALIDLFAVVQSWFFCDFENHIFWGTFHVKNSFLTGICTDLMNFPGDSFNWKVCNCTPNDPDIFPKKIGYLSYCKISILTSFRTAPNSGKHTWANVPSRPINEIHPTITISPRTEWQ
jgi:hypothetical protein